MYYAVSYFNFVQNTDSLSVEDCQNKLCGDEIATGWSYKGFKGEYNGVSHTHTRSRVIQSLFVIVTKNTYSCCLYIVFSLHQNLISHNTKYFQSLKFHNLDHFTKDSETGLRNYFGWNIWIKRKHYCYWAMSVQSVLFLLTVNFTCMLVTSYACINIKK